MPPRAKYGDALTESELAVVQDVLRGTNVCPMSQRDKDMLYRARVKLGVANAAELAWRAYQQGVFDWLVNW